jgi:hypothetical protein
LHVYEFAFPANMSSSHSSRANLHGYLQNQLQLDRHAERKAGDAVHQSGRVFVFSEDVLQQRGRAIGDLRLVWDIS